jgi:hypothetical protein
VRIIYAVRFSNYEPAEIDSLWMTKADAESRCNDIDDGGMWGVHPMEVIGSKAEFDERMEPEDFTQCVKSLEEQMEVLRAGAAEEARKAGMTIENFGSSLSLVADVLRVMRELGDRARKGTP